MMKLTKSSRVFRRAMAFVLAAAMTLSAPVATQASAASKKKVPTLSVKKKTLYYNKSGKKSFTLKVKKNKVKKIVKTKWTTSKKSIVGISAKKKTSVKVTAKKKGSAKIKATVTYKVGAKTKTKKLTCKVTSKKAKVTPEPTSNIDVTKNPDVTPAPSDGTTETAAPTKNPDETTAPTEEPKETAAPTDEPTDAKAVASSITAIEVDGADFQFSLLLDENKDNEAAVKNAKLDLKNGSISVTASFKEMENANSAIFKIDDSKVLKPGDRSADGKFEVTTTSKSLTLPAGAYTTYEEAIDALAVEGFVTTPKLDNNGNPIVTEYVPVADATITLIENGKTVKTDGNGYYKMTTSSGSKTLRVEKNGYISQITPSDHIIVNKSHLTSQNFVLATFNPDKIKVNITVLDGEDGMVIPGANVQILDAEGKAVPNAKTDVVTDGTGVSKFGNCLCGADVAVNGVNTDKNIQWEEPNFFEKDKTYKIKVSKGLSWAHLTQDRSGSHDNGIYEENTVEVTINTKHEYDVTVRLRPIKELPSLKVTQKYDEDTFEYAKAPDRTTDIAAEEGIDPTRFEVYTKYELYADYDGNGIAEELATYSKDASRHDELEGIPEALAKTGADPVTGQCTTKINKNAETDVNMLDPNGDGNNADNLLGLAGKPCLPSGTYYLILRSYTDGTYTTPAAETDYTVAEIKVEEGKDCAVTVERKKPVSIDLQTSLDPDKATGDVQNKAATGNALKSVVRSTPDNHSSDYTVNTERVYTQNTLYRKMGTTLIKVENSEVAYTYNSALTDADKPYTDLTLVYKDKNVFQSENQYTHLTIKEDYIVRARSNYAVADDLEVRVKDNDGKTISLQPRFRFNQIKIKKQADDALKDGNNTRPITKIRVLNSAGKEISVKDLEWWKPIAGGSTPAADGDFATFNDADLQKVLFETDLDNKVKIEVTLKDCNPVTSGEINITDLEYVNVEITEKVTPVTGRTKLTGTVTVNKKDGTVAKDFTNDGIGDASNNVVQVMLYNSANKIVAFGKTSDPKNGVSSYNVVQGTGSNKELKAGDYKLVARGYHTETYVTTVTLKDQETTTLDLVLDEGGQGSAKTVITDTNKNGIDNIHVVAYDSNFADATYWGSWASYSAPAIGTAADRLDAGLYGRYEGVNVDTQDNNVAGAVPSKTEKQINNLSVGSYTIHFYQTSEFSTVNDTFTFSNQTLVLSTNGESKRPVYEFLPVGVAPGGKVRLTIRQTAPLTTRVALAKPLDADGKELDQIEDIYYAGRVQGTYPSQGSMNAGQANYTVLMVDPHRAYNVYVYDFSGKYVVKQMKNVEGVDAEMTIDYTVSSHD